MGKEIKKRMVILSDIHGLENANWATEYADILGSEFDVVSYCSLHLAEINSAQSSEDIHSQMVNGGVDRAAKKLIDLEPDVVTVLGFSIGGLIGWKAGLLDLTIETLYAVSSTRLRKELAKPKGELKLIFGEDDSFSPDEMWYQKMEIIPKILPREAHGFYQKPDFIKQFASQIIWSNGIIY